MQKANVNPGYNKYKYGSDMEKQAFIAWGGGELGLHPKGRGVGGALGYTNALGLLPIPYGSIDIGGPEYGMQLGAVPDPESEIGLSPLIGARFGHPRKSGITRQFPRGLPEVIYDKLRGRTKEDAIRASYPDLEKDRAERAEKKKAKKSPKADDKDEAEKKAFAGLIGAGAGGIIGAANLPDDATPQERARYAARGAIRGAGIGSGMSAGVALGELGRRLSLKGRANPSTTRQVIATLLPMLGGGIGSYAGYEIADEFARNPALGTDSEPDAGDKAKADKREERMEKEKQGSDGILSGLFGPSEEEKQKQIEQEKLDKAVARNMRERLARRIAKEKMAEDAAGIAYLSTVLEKAAKRGLWDNVHAKRKRGEKPAKKGDKDYPDEKSWKKTTKEAALKGLVLEKIAKSPAWQRKAGKNSEGGLNAKGRASYNKSTGGNLKAPVTSKKPKGKAKKRKASFCARMSGMKKKNTSKATANDPDSRINKSLRKWNC